MRSEWRAAAAVIAAFCFLCVFPALESSVAKAAPDASIRTDVELTTKDVGLRETVLADVVSDAIKDDAKADVALIDASAFEDSVTIPKGSFTIPDLIKSLSYKSDTIYVMKLSGAQVRDALEHGLFLYPKFNSAFLQVSGLTVTINPDGDADHHVVSMKSDGDNVDPSHVYRVAMRAPLANGGLAYSKVWKTSEKKDTGKSLEAAITSYLMDHRTITKGDDRLVIKGK